MKRKGDTVVARSIRELLGQCQIDRVLLAVLAGVPPCDKRARFAMLGGRQQIAVNVCPVHREQMLMLFPTLTATALPIDPSEMN